MTNYYVASDGDDGNDGQSEASAWKTLSKVNEFSFVPGDFCGFKRGDIWIGSGTEWSGALNLWRSGEENNPIAFGAYGEGDDPIIRNPGNNTWGIYIGGAWIDIGDICVEDSHEAGIYIEESAYHISIQNNEIVNVGIGVLIRGQNNLVKHNLVHNLSMVVNDAGEDNDYGAIGVGLFNSHNEVSYNRFIDCIAPSQDYGVDGGAIEFRAPFGAVDYCQVHHNVALGCEGFFEIGGGVFCHNVISHNALMNNGRIAVIHLGGNHAAAICDLRFEDNNIFEVGGGETLIEFIDGEVNEENFSMEGNFFHVEGFSSISNKSGFGRKKNYYRLINSELGYNLGEESKII